MDNLISAKSYREYLVEEIKSRPKGGRGLRSQLAAAMGCQVGFVTQVLKGQAHFSLEQAEKINSVLGHSKEESYYFMLLVQFTRAGTPTLQHFFAEQMQAAKERYLNLKNRLNIKSKINLEEQSIYYSAWYYAAFHIAIALPHLQSREALAKHFQIPTQRCGEILDFLTSAGLAIKNGDHYCLGEGRIHLGADSPLISKHHTNWRMQAIRSLDSSTTEDVHFSLIMGISDEDSVKIRALFVKTIEQVNQILRDSKESGVHCFNLDFFRL